MDHGTLHKKLSTYLSEKGQLRNLPDELLYEVLHAWEIWQGKAKEFYKSVGFSQRQMAGLLGKAKKLKRQGYFSSELFTEIKVDSQNGDASIQSSDGSLIEIEWQPGKVLRFHQVEQLLEFLKKAG